MSETIRFTNEPLGIRLYPEVVGPGEAQLEEVLVMLKDLDQIRHRLASYADFVPASRHVDEARRDLIVYVHDHFDDGVYRLGARTVTRVDSDV